MVVLVYGSEEDFMREWMDIVSRNNLTEDENNDPVIGRDGTKTWYDSNAECHRADGPAIEHPDGTWAWEWHGVLHRTNGPAELCYFNNKKAYFWYQKGKLSNTKGPAIRSLDGSYMFWYINDSKLDLMSLAHVDITKYKKIIIQMLLYNIINHEKAGNRFYGVLYIEELKETIEFLKEKVKWKELNIIQKYISFAKIEN